MSNALEPLSIDPDDYVFVDVETRSHEDVTVFGSYRHNAKGRVTIFTYALGDATGVISHG